MHYVIRRVLVPAIIAALAISVAPAAAHDSGSLTHKAKYLRVQVKREHGERAAGRDVVRQGIRYCHEHRGRRGNHCHIRGARKADRIALIQQFRKLLRPAPAYLQRTAVPPGQRPAGTQSAGVQAGGVLQRIASCESGGNPGAISPDGLYRGKYQFDYGTWRSVGGSGDPAAAPEAEQDRRAAMLYSRRGNAPWPNC